MQEAHDQVLQNIKQVRQTSQLGKRQVPKIIGSAQIIKRFIYLQTIIASCVEISNRKTCRLQQEDVCFGFVSFFVRLKLNYRHIKQSHSSAFNSASLNFFFFFSIKFDLVTKLPSNKLVSPLLFILLSSHSLGERQDL